MTYQFCTLRGVALGLTDSDGRSTVTDGLPNAVGDGRISPEAAGVSDNDQCAVPHAIPWPYAADEAGVAFPAGLVGVVTFALPETESDANNAINYTAVPGTLPVGYTAHNSTGIGHGGDNQDGRTSILHRGLLYQDGIRKPHLWGQSHLLVFEDTVNGATPQNENINAINFWPRLMINGGPHELSWCPMNRGQTCRTLSNAMPGTMKWFDISPGWRNIRVKVIKAGAGAITFTNVQLIATRNADYSKGGSDAVPGTTAIATVTALPGEFGLSGGNWVGPNMDITAATWPDGQMGSVHIEVRVNGGTDTFLGQVLYLSPRCDIPWPWVVLGPDAIAPGGYLASKLAVPALRAPAVWVANAGTQVVSRFANGDGANFYGYADVTPGAHYRMSSSGSGGLAVWTGEWETGPVSVSGGFGVDYEFDAPPGVTRLFFIFSSSVASGTVGLFSP